MAIEYNEGIKALKALVEASGIKGEWSDGGMGKQTFKSQRRGTLNYWPHKGTIQCQGRQDGSLHTLSILTP